MTRRDLRRRWLAAASIPDLGELTAQWLEGSMPLHPADWGSTPDEETGPLTETLAALNRFGYLTDNSQPGESELGDDGALWVQRAAVCGYVAAGDTGTLRMLRSAAAASGAVYIEHRGGRPAMKPRGGVPATTRDDEDVTWFGGWLTRRQVVHSWSIIPISRAAASALRTAHQVTIIDPVWGPSTRLWDALNAAMGKTHTTITEK